MPVHSGTHPVAHSRRLHLPAVEENLQPGVYRRLVENARARNVEYSKIWELFAFQERFTIHLARFTEGVLRTPTSISPGLRELIAAYTSHLNECRFCTEAHAAAAAELLGSEELVRSVLADLDSAPLHAREKALLRFAAKVTTNLPAVTGQDVEELSYKRKLWIGRLRG